MRHAKSFTLATATVALTFTLAACGSEAPVLDDPSPSAAPTEAEGLTSITVGVLPIVDVAPLYLGVETGIFEEHGLDVEIVKAESGPALVPGVTSGEFDFGFSNATSLLLAQAGGNELQIVAPGNFANADAASDFSSLVVPTGSAVASVADLAGKKVAVNAPKSLLQATISSQAEAAGVDPATIEFVPMGFGEMPAALTGGAVDAAFVVEPFLTITKQAGATPLDVAFASLDPELMVAGYFTTDAYASENAETVEAFVAAMTESLEEAQADSDAVREALDLYTEIDPAVKSEMTLPTWLPEVSEDSLSLQAELAQKYNFSEGAELDPSGLLP